MKSVHFGELYTAVLQDEIIRDSSITVGNTGIDAMKDCSTLEYKRVDLEWDQKLATKSLKVCGFYNRIE